MNFGKATIFVTMKTTMQDVIGMGEIVVEEIRIFIRMDMHIIIAQNAFALKNKGQ